MLRVGFEPMSPAFEGEKAVHALDLAAIVIGGREASKVRSEPGGLHSSVVF
jgi:hypothetical protein